MSGYRVVKEGATDQADGDSQSVTFFLSFFQFVYLSATGFRHALFVYGNVVHLVQKGYAM